MKHKKTTTNCVHKKMYSLSSLNFNELRVEKQQNKVKSPNFPSISRQTQNKGF